MIGLCITVARLYIATKLHIILETIKKIQEFLGGKMILFSIGGKAKTINTMITTVSAHNLTNN